MKTIYTFLVCVACLFGGSAWGQACDTIIYFNGTSISPAGGSAANASQTINTFGANSIGLNSAICGSVNSYKATGWDAGMNTKYWFTSVNTIGYTAIQISFTLRSTSTGPRDFKLQYNTDGINWNDVPGLSISLGSGCTTISNNSLPATTGQIANLQLRWIMTSNSNVSGTATGPGGISNIADISITGTPAGLIPPALNAASGATVDNPINITFSENSAWRAAIAKVTIGSCVTLPNTAYTISAGQFTLVPANYPLFQAPGTYTIAIHAPGYNNATVSQTISSGAPNTITITTQPAAPTTSGGVLATQPALNAKDKYGNNSVGYNITASVTSGQTGNWSLGGTNSVVTNSSGNAAYSGLTATNLTAAPYPASISFSYGGVITTSNTFTIPAITPTLTAASNATVDAPFSITFTPDNASWRGAITGITVNGTALPAGAYSTTTPGQIVFYPANSTLLQTPGTKTIAVSATGYTPNPTSISQTISAGAPFTLTITKQPAAPTSYTGTFATQPIVKAVDKYGNVVTGSYTIAATVTSGQAGSWTLGGTTGVATSSTGLATYTDLTATNLTTNPYTASITFSYGSATVTSNTFVIPAPPPSNDDCSGAVTITPAASPAPVTAGTFLSSSPTAVILGYVPSKNDVWYKFTPACTGSYTITINYTYTTGVEVDFDAYAGGCPAAGAIGDPIGHNHAAAGLQTKTANLTAGTVYYVRVIDYGSVSAGNFNIGVTVNPPAQPSSISGTTTPCFNANEFYSVAPIIAGVSYSWTLPGATWSGGLSGSSINVSVGGDVGNLTVTPTNGCGLVGPSLSMPVTPITSPLNVSNVNVNPSNGKVTISWDNPPNCFDAIMVVATDNSGNITLIPSGDGTQYVDTTEFASQTKDNSVNMNTGEYCIYKGLSTAVIMTNLLNGNPYTIKIFTRWGTQWSSGVQVAAIRPAAAFTGAYKSIKSGVWTDNTVWNKFDGTNWIPTSDVTDFPNSYKSDVTIVTNTIVQLNQSNIAVKNLEVKPSAQLWTSTQNAVNRYITVFGDITCDGTIGNANPQTLDYISFNIEAISSTISGTGTFSCSRIRKEFTAGTTGGTNVSTLNINKDINLFWPGSAAIYNDADNDTLSYTKFNVNLNSPYSLTLKGANSNVSIDGPSGNNSNSRSGGKFTINGTLTIPGVLYLTSDNSSAGYPCNFEIGSTGKVYTNIVVASASGSAIYTLTMKPGSLLNIGDIQGFSIFSQKNNTNILSAGSTIEYSGNGNQLVLSGMSYQNLTLSGSGAKALSDAYLVTSINGTLTINANNTFSFDGKTLNLDGTIAGSGTISGSSTSKLIIGPGSTLTSAPLGVLKFTSGSQRLNVLTMNRMMRTDTYPNHKYWAAVLGSNLSVDTLNLNQGIIATDKYLLSLTNYPANAYSTFNKASYVATTDTLATPFPLVNTYDGSFGFRIDKVPSNNTDTYFPVGADFISPNRAMINLGASASRDVAIVMTKGDIGYTGAPRVNRIWYMSSSNKSSLSAKLRLYYTAYDLSSNAYLSKQDELETGFTNLHVRLVEKAFLADRYFTNISNNSDVLTNFSTGTEKYAQYTTASTVYNGTNPGIFQFGVFSIVDSGNVVLPVTFTGIRAYQHGSGININWSVANEINIDRYEVERAGDSRLFTTIATQQVPINNSSAGSSYTASDMQPLTGANYYRIKAVGNDGQVLYSTIVNITLSSDGKAGMLVYPNPIKNKQCTLQFNNLVTGTYNINVYSMSGQLITSKQIVHAGGSSSEKLYLPAGIAAGVYIIKLTGQSVNMQTSVFVGGK